MVSYAGMVPFRHIGVPFRAMGIHSLVDPQPGLTGTFMVTPTEAEVVTGGQTVIITLADGKWIRSANFDDHRQSILDAFVSAQSEAAGWNAEFDPNVTTVVRTNDTQVTITLPAIAAYSITADEEITLTPPRGAIAGQPATPPLANAIVIAAGG